MNLSLENDLASLRDILIRAMPNFIAFNYFYKYNKYNITFTRKLYSQLIY